MELILPAFLRRKNIKALIAPDGILSLGTSCPQIACIHDLNFVHQPQDLNFRNRTYYNFFFGRFARKASRIATVSEYSKTDITKSYGILPYKIDVVYCGIKEGLKPLTESMKSEIQAQISCGCPYFFFAGSLHPRKNIIRLIKAFNKYKQKTNSNTRLVLAGNFMWDNPGLKETIDTIEHKTSIIFTGHVSEEDLARFYAAALAVVFVPTFEGFGIPIIEAFASGTPVICSNVTSMPEVAGDAALLVDPLSLNDIAEAMEKIAYDLSLQQSLIKKGFDQMRRFSWDKTANLLWQTCTKALT